VVLGWWRLEYLTCEKRLTDPMACLAKSKLRDSVMAAYNCLEGGYKDDGAQLLSAVPADISRGSGHELEVQEVPVELERKTNQNRKAVRHKGMVETPERSQNFAGQNCSSFSLALVTVWLQQEVGLNGHQRSFPARILMVL